jgi:ElaA protein
MIQWKCTSFDQLTARELYAILQLRNQVFVIEQQCIFQDADNKDQYCYHHAGWKEDQLVAYTRLVPAGIIYKEASIGRVVTSPPVRKAGYGKLLMEHSINWIYSQWGNQPIRIGAQLYLKKFYESLGFLQCSDIYLEDNIEHILMLKD